jgi:hypothetical protein
MANPGAGIAGYVAPLLAATTGPRLDAIVTALRELQLPPELISLITYLFAEVLDGRNASTADGVERALGRPARDFADYVRETAATGVWNGGSHR